MINRLFSKCFFSFALIAVAINNAPAESMEDDALRQLLLKAKAISFSSQPKAAIQFYKQALAKDPNNSEAYAGLGWVYYQSGNAATAISYEKRAIALDPGNAEPHYYLAAIYTSQKHYQTASDERTLAINLAKKRPCNCGQQSKLLEEMKSKTDTTVR